MSLFKFLLETIFIVILGIAKDLEAASGFFISFRMTMRMKI
ncbi:hypothetical protein [Phocaeicola sp.]